MPDFSFDGKKIPERGNRLTIASNIMAENVGQVH